MVSLSRQVLSVRVLLRVMGGGAFLLLASCESGTAPAPESRVSAPAGQPALADRAPAKAIVVVGTGNPAVDVPAVQAAVDQGGSVLLQGHFSFDAPATKPLAPFLLTGKGYPSAAEVLISHAVTVSGARGDDDEMATIDGGTLPFYVEAPGEQVTIRRLRFVGPTSGAIFVSAVRGLEIASSSITKVVPFATNGSAVWVVTAGNIPMPASQGHPENVSGALRIVDNDIDMAGGTSSDNTLGITVFSAGDHGVEVDALVAGNRIRNTREPAINFRRIVGRAYIAHNTIVTGTNIGSAGRNSAIRVANIGSYVVAHNSIRCEWATTEGEGIGVFSQIPAWPMEHAIVEHNDITMAPPAGTAFTDFSAGIGLYGFANYNVVRNNTIRGDARAGIATPDFPTPSATPQGNAFVDNRFVQFTPTLADIFVGANALMTHIVGRATIENLSQTTSIDRNPLDDDHEPRN